MPQLIFHHWQQPWVCHLHDECLHLSQSGKYSVHINKKTHRFEGTRQCYNKYTTARFEKLYWNSLKRVQLNSHAPIVVRFIFMKMRVFPWSSVVFSIHLIISWLRRIEQNLQKTTSSPSYKRFLTNKTEISVMATTKEILYCVLCQTYHVPYRARLYYKLDLRWLNTVLAVCEYMSFAKSWQEKGYSSQAETWQVKICWWKILIDR